MKSKILKDIVLPDEAGAEPPGMLTGWHCAPPPLLPAVTKVDRAVSPMPQPKKKKPSVDKNLISPEQQQLREQEVAAQARRDALQEFENANPQRQQVTNALQFLRLALAYLLASADAPAAELVDPSVVAKPPADVMEHMTAVILQLAADKTTAIRAAYNTFRLRCLDGERSRCVFFSNDMVSKGIMCEMIQGKEAVLQSPEAIQHAVAYDIRIFSDQRHQKRLKALTPVRQQLQTLQDPETSPASPPPDAVAEAEAWLVDQQQQQGTFSDGGGGAGGRLPSLRGSQPRDDLTELMGMRRLQSNKHPAQPQQQQHHLHQGYGSYTPEPMTHWQSSPPQAKGRSPYRPK